MTTDWKYLSRFLHIFFLHFVLLDSLQYRHKQETRRGIKWFDMQQKFSPVIKRRSYLYQPFGYRDNLNECPDFFFLCSLIWGTFTSVSALILNVALNFIMCSWICSKPRQETWSHLYLTHKWHLSPGFMWEQGVTRRQILTLFVKWFDSFLGDGSASLKTSSSSEKSLPLFKSVFVERKLNCLIFQWREKNVCFCFCFSAHTTHINQQWHF